MQPPALASYSFAPRAFGRPLTLVLEEDTLVVDDTIREQRIPLSDIVLMRMTYEPTNMLGRSFSTRLVVGGGRSLTIASRHMAGLARIEDRTPGYAAFVAKLAPAIARANPACRFAAGRPWFSFAMLAAVSAATAAGIVALLMNAWPRAATMMFLVLALAGAGLLWVMAEMVRRNRPRPLDPTNLPPDLVG